MSRATDYIDATGISTDKFVTAAKALFADLINYGFLQPLYPSANISRDKLVALYPRSGGTETSNSINAVNPAKYNLVTHNSYTHDMSGSTPNGTNAYCDTGLNLLSRMANYKMTIGYLSLTNTAPGSGDNRFLFGVAQGSTQTSINNFATNRQQSYSTGSCQISLNPISVFNQFFAVIRNGDSQMSLYGNDTKLSSDNTTLTIERHADGNLYLDALNNAGTPAFFNDNKCGGLVVADGMSDYEWKNFRRIFMLFKASII